MDNTAHDERAVAAHSTRDPLRRTHERVLHDPGRILAAVAAASALVLSILCTVWIIRGEHNPLDHANILFAAALNQYPHGWANGIFLGCTLIALAGSLGMMLARRPAADGHDHALWMGAVGIAALILLMDSSALTSMGYLPIMIAAPFLGITQLSWSMFLSVPLVLQFVLLLTVAAIGAGMASRMRRRWLRTDLADPVSQLTRATKRTRLWAKIAMEAPLVYALSRVLMFLCVPGFDLAPFGAPVLWAGLGLAFSGATGALLTWGLIRPWGERFPRWIPSLGGRRVPISLAVIPGLLVAVMVATTAKSMLLQSLSLTPHALDTLFTWPLIVLPMLLWPLWALALALATINYGIRRRLAEALSSETRIDR